MESISTPFPQRASTTTTPNPFYTNLELHTATTLSTSPHFPALFTLINHTFDHAQTSRGYCLLPQWRLKTQEQLSQEVGPDGFTFLMLQDPQNSTGKDGQLAEPSGYRSPDGKRVIGTAGAKPYMVTRPDEPGGETHRLFKRAAPPSSTNSTAAETQDGGTPPQWEILCMAVDPLLQGQGLASQLLDLTIEEIKRREKGKREIMLLLSTMKILNEAYYAKRGWTTTATKEFPPGTGESRDGFAVVDMYRRVEAREVEKP